MNKLNNSSSRAIAAALVAASGFAGGAVFVTALLAPSQARNPVTLIATGMAGALFYLLAWWIINTLLAPRLNQSTDNSMRRTGFIFAASLIPLISYFPYLIYRSSLEGESLELPPLASSTSVIILFLWSMLLLSTLLRLNLGSSESTLFAKITRRPAFTLAAMIVIWMAVFLPLDILKDQYMQVTTVNSALFREAMLHVLDDRGFMFSNFLYGSGASIFTVHINAIFIFIFPIFRIWPDYRFLLFMGDLALALSAWPAYLIARRHFTAAISLVFAAMVVLNPVITAQPGRGDFSEIRFMPVLFLTAFYLFEKKRFWMFALTSLAMMTIREDISLFVMFFGIYGLMQRRSLKWILGPFVAGLGWFVAFGAILLAHLGPGGSAVRASLRYSNLGNSGGEIARTILFHPVKTLQAALATPSHIGAAYGIFLISGLGIALFSGAIIFAIPAVAELMLQQTTTFVNFMAVPLAPTLTVAIILAISRIDRFCQRRYRMRTGAMAALVAVFVLFVTASSFHAWFNPDLYRPRYNYDAALQAFEQLPADARLMMPEFMLMYSAPNQTVRGFHQVKYQEDFEGRFDLTEDYVFLDLRVPTRLAADNKYYDNMEQVKSLVANSPDFVKVFDRDDIELYVRKDSGNG